MTKWKRPIVLVLLLVVMFVLQAVVGHHVRVVAKESDLLGEMVRLYDGFQFTVSGGGNSGYRNFYVHKYAGWRADPTRTTFERWLFWDRGILCDFRYPPATYPY